MASNAEIGRETDQHREALRSNLHQLSNSLHSLSLRLLLLEAAGVEPEAREHLEAIRRFSDQSVSLLSNVRELCDQPDPPADRSDPTTRPAPR
jgi:hypothetical protein